MVDQAGKPALLSGVEPTSLSEPGHRTGSIVVSDATSVAVRAAPHRRTGSTLGSFRGMTAFSSYRLTWLAGSAPWTVDRAYDRVVGR